MQTRGSRPPLPDRPPGRPSQDPASPNLDPDLVVRNFGLAFLCGEPGPARPFSPREVAAAIGVHPATVQRGLDSIRPLLAAMRGGETEQLAWARTERNARRRRRSNVRSDD